MIQSLQLNLLPSQGDVELTMGAKPFFTCRPRQNPLHWKEKVKKEVQKLIKQGVIERIPANECALWLSPASFVAKNKKEEKLRIVCDLRNLNKCIKDDCSIFPPSLQTRQEYL